MDLELVQQLVQRGEAETIEFKKSTTQLKAALQTVCAFLNHQGGYVFIGLDQKGQILGQTVTDNTFQEIAREVSKIEPTQPLTIHYIPVTDDRQVIAIKVLPGQHAPYIYDDRAYYRNQTSTMRMPQHLYEQLLVKRGQLNYSWDEQIADGYTIADLDQNEIQRTVQQGILANRITADLVSNNFEDILMRLNLLKAGKLTNAAVVLFAKKIMPPYSHCLIKLARFKGIDKLGEFIDNQTIYGNAFKILTDASHFISRHLSIASLYSALSYERLDKPALPILAIREALINAICHRDYANRSTAIMLAIFDDRMEIWNNGILLSPLKIEDLGKNHQSLLRNKLIAEVFYNRGLVEGWGTGTTKIITLCKEHGIPNPEFEEDSGGLSVKLYFKQPSNIPYRGCVSEPETDYNAPKLQLSIRQQAILAIIEKQGGIADIRQVMAELISPPSPRMVKKDLQQLSRIGLIRLQGAARNSVWVLNKKPL